MTRQAGFMPTRAYADSQNTLPGIPSPFISCARSELKNLERMLFFSVWSLFLHMRLFELEGI
jgi:hypothetical protein